MRVSSVLTSATLLASSALAISDQRLCGPDNDLKLSPLLESIVSTAVREIQTAVDLVKAGSTLFRRMSDIEAVNSVTGTKTIDVWFHTVKKADTEDASDGHITDEQIVNQLAVLNADYMGIFQYNLVGNTTTINQEWFEQASSYDDGKAAQTAMKAALRQGDISTLNLYAVGFRSGQAAAGLLGYATYPSSSKFNFQDDGVVFQGATVPGGALENYNAGRTVTHETGHWLGLYHTFQNGCTEGGDEVSDTPAEAYPASGCPDKTRDSCPGLDGLDPVRNYMDYAYDACMDEFTAGQAVRMHAQVSSFRGM